MKHRFLLLGLLTVMAMLLPATVKAQCDSGTPVSITISGNDSYGDGWEGSLTIYRNNVQMSTFTVDASTNELVLTVCQGDSIRVEWSGSDQYYENTFSILNCTEAVVTDAHGYTYAPSGVVASFVANCPTCLPVTNMVVSNVETTSLTLGWTDDANTGASYTITYVDAQGVTQTLTSTTTSVDVTGLEANTLYTFSVVANCSATDNSSALTASFKTACPVAACTIEVTPDGNTFYYGYAHVDLVQGNATLGSYPTSSYMSGSLSVEVCPTAPIKVMYVETSSYASYYSGSVTVVDGGGAEVFSGSTDDADADGLLYLMTAPCPTCFRPDSVEFSDVTTDGATMTWVAGNGESEWLIFLGDSLVADVMTNSYTFSDLDANTGYTVNIRSYCGGTDTSSARTVSFRTACEGSTCDLTLELGSTSTWSSPWSYGATVELTQSGGSLGTYGSTTTVEVCGSAPIVVSYNGASYSYYDSYATIVVKNGGGVEVYNGGNSGLPATISDVCPSCLPPTALAVSDVEQEGFTFEWTPRSEATLFAIYLNGTLVESAWTDTSYTFTDLTSNTAYTAGVQAICSDDDSSAIASVSTRTACGEIAIPYMVDFEDAAFNGAWYPCWDSIIHYNTDPSVNNVRNHTDGGTYSMYMQGENFIVSPQVPLPGNAIQVTFWAYLNNSGRTIEAGVISDPSDTSTFVPLVTITGIGSGWNEYQFNTGTLSADETYYVAWHSYGSNSQIGSFDDVTISEFTGCDRPQTSEVVEVGPYTATLRWTASASAADYIVYYSTTNDFNGDNVMSQFVNGDTTVTLEGLLPQTTYYCWVATNCGSAVSDPKSFPYFTTQLTCAPVENVTLENITYVAAQLSWSYNTAMGFPTEEVEMVLVDNTTGETVDSNYYTGTSHTYTGLTSGHSYTVRMRNICQTTQSVDTANVVTFSFMTTSCSEISGDGSQTSNYVPFYYNYCYSYAQMIYTANEMGVIDTINGIAWNTSSSSHRNIDIYLGYTSLNEFDGSNTFVPLTNLTLMASESNYSYTPGWNVINFDSAFVYDHTQGNLVIAVDNNEGAWSGYAGTWYVHGTDVKRSIYSYSDNDNYDPSTVTTASYGQNYVPDIRFVSNCQAPSCYAPMLSLVDLDSNSITINWWKIGDESNFVVRYKAHSDTVYTNEGTLGDTSFVFTNLQAATLYDILVGSICGSDTLWSVMNVRTNCGVMQVPYVVDFETQNTDEAPVCWSALGSYNYSNVIYPAISGNGHSSNRAVRMRSNAAMIMVSDSVPLPGDSISVSFWANPYSSTLEAGVMSDPTDASTFHSLITATGGYNSSYGFYEFNTATLSGDTTYYVAFRHTAGGTYYYTDIDDIMIRRDDGCRRPTNLSVDSIDITYAELSWSANGGNSTEWVLMYSMNGGTTWTTTTTTTPSAILTGLTGASNYIYKVGAVCSSDTLWADQQSFTTGCAPYTMPMYEDFDSFAEDVLPPCWYFNSPSSITHYDGGLFFRSYGGGINNYAVMPVMQAPLSKVQITFNVKVGTPTENDGIVIGAANDDGTVVEWLDTIQRADFSRNAHKLLTYDFLEYTGTGSRIALAQLRSWNEWALIDSITVIQLPDCYTPLEPSVTTMDINSVSLNPGTVYMGSPDDSLTLNWKRHGEASQWQVYLDTMGAVTQAALDSMPDSLFTIVNDTFYVVPAGTLMGGGKYKFWVRSDCDYVQSPWASYEFGAGAVKMNQSTTADTVTGCGFVVYDNGYDAGYLAPSNSALVLRPTVANDELQVFGGLFGFGTDQATLTIYDGEGTSGNVLFTYNLTGTHNDRRDSVLATSTEGAMTIVFNATGYSAHTGYELYIRCVDGASCHRPDVTLSSYSYDEATLTWDGGNAAEYHVYYRAEGETDWTMTSVSTSTATLTGLTPTTQYEAYVIGVCSSTDSSYASHHVNFTTICAPVTITETEPMVEDFEAATAPADCFTMVYGDNNPSVNTMTHDASQYYGGSRSFRFNSMTNTTDYNQYLVTPMLQATDNMLVSFYTKTNVSTAPLRIGYSTTGNDVTTDFVWNAAVTVSDSWTQLTATIPANAKFVALNYAPTSSLYYLYVDSLVISVSSDTEACFAPSITGVTASVDAITVNYSADTVVEAAITTGSVWPATISGVTVPAGTTTYTFNGLAPNTQYTIGLRTVCGGDNYSPWSTQTVTTLEAPCDVPTDVAYSNVDYTSAVITWNGGNASQWEVRVADGDNVETTTVSVPSISLDRLEPGTQYNVMVRAICSATNVSDWSTTVTFTTLDCVTPTNLSASNVTTTSAMLNWNSTASSWELEVNDVVSTVTEKPYQLTGLTDNTNYTVRVRAICTDSLMSEWSAPAYFTTEAVGIENVDDASIALYPNPASTTVTIDLNGIEGDAVVSIIDLNGRRCGEWKSENGKVVVDLTGYARGAYFVRVTGENTSAIRKLVVK